MIPFHRLLKMSRVFQTHVCVPHKRAACKKSFSKWQKGHRPSQLRWYPTACGSNLVSELGDAWGSVGKAFKKVRKKARSAVKRAANSLAKFGLRKVLRLFGIKAWSVMEWCYRDFRSLVQPGTQTVLIHASPWHWTRAEREKPYPERKVFVDSFDQPFLRSYMSNKEFDKVVARRLVPGCEHDGFEVANGRSRLSQHCVDEAKKQGIEFELSTFRVIVERWSANELQCAASFEMDYRICADLCCCSHGPVIATQAANLLHMRGEGDTQICNTWFMTVGFAFRVLGSYFSSVEAPFRPAPMSREASVLCTRQEAMCQANQCDQHDEAVAAKMNTFVPKHLKDVCWKSSGTMTKQMDKQLLGDLLNQKAADENTLSLRKCGFRNPEETCARQRYESTP